jgi:hypothetical protein
MHTSGWNKDLSQEHQTALIAGGQSSSRHQSRALLTRNSYSFAGEGIIKNSSVRTANHNPTRSSGSCRISILHGHRIHGKLAPGGGENLIKDEGILNMTNMH